MNEATLTFKGRAKDLSKLKAQFYNLGFTVVDSDKDKLTLEKIETSDLKGRPHHFYRITFYPDKLVFTYSQGANRRKRDVEALAVLLHAIKVAEDYYSVEAGDLYAPITSALHEARALFDSETHANIQQISELQERFFSLEKKYKDLVISSEQNARILLECEKKRDEYAARIKQLEGMSDETLMRELFSWLKAHGGEINIAEFSKAYGVSQARTEEGLERLLKEGYIRKKG